MPAQLIGADSLESIETSAISGLTGTVNSGDDIVFTIKPPTNKYWVIQYFANIKLSDASTQGATAGFVSLGIGHLNFAKSYISGEFAYNESGILLSGVDSQNAGTLNKPTSVENLNSVDLVHTNNKPMKIRINNQTDVSLDVGQLVDEVRPVRGVYDL